MSVESLDTIAIARERERLRQETQTFDQKHKQDRRWFALRLAMGWGGIVLLLFIGGLSGWIVARHTMFSTETVTFAAFALFVNSLSLAFAVWRIVLGAGPQELKPVTNNEDGSGQSQSQRRNAA